MMLVTAPILTIGMMLSGIVPQASHGDVWFFLLTRMPIIALVAIGLAISTTTRVVGPMVHLRRVFEDVKSGDMDRRLSFRKSDEHLREVETAFDEMMVALSERADSRRRPKAEADGADIGLTTEETRKLLLGK